MAKSLGQIHTVNNDFSGLLVQGSRYNIDLPGELTSQLQRMVRAGTFHKLVGIDITARPSGLPNPANGAQVSGRLLYFTPTRGRCEAFRSAFRSVAEMMKTQGVSMRDNAFYDFKVPINDENTVRPIDFQNQATLDGTNGLALVNTNSGASIFGVHNEGVRAIGTGTAADLFTSGFNTILQSGGTDFVLNDTQPYTGNHMYASEEYEEIPFVCSWDPTATNSSSETVKFEYRPDPALYIAILCGQLQVVIDDVIYTGATPGSVSLQISTQIAGWKSIMGSPDKKPRRSKKRSGKKA